MIELDHLVFGTRDLNQGAIWLEQKLGASLAAGGQHLGFGTHNRLLNLGDQTYLELIALDPAQVLTAQAGSNQPTQYKPLFGLSYPPIDDYLAEDPNQPCRLLAWVVRSPNLKEALRQLPLNLIGQPVPMSRGNYRWTFAHRADGLPVPEGLPAAIEWGNTAHPCTRLPDSGVRLEHLHVECSSATAYWLTNQLQFETRVRWSVIEPSKHSSPKGHAIPYRLRVQFRVQSGDLSRLVQLNSYGG